MGIEPTSSAWKAEVLPLNYTRSYRPLQPLTGSHFTAMIVVALSLIRGLAPLDQVSIWRRGGGLLHACGIPPSGPSRLRDVQSRCAALVEPLVGSHPPPNTCSGEESGHEHCFKAGLFRFWWRGEDSNLRRLSRQIYSLIPLATREPLQKRGRILLYVQTPVNTVNTIIPQCNMTLRDRKWLG